MMLTFERGDMNHSVSVPLIDDDIVENLERFFVTAISSQVGVEIISPQRIAVIITNINDDSKFKVASLNNRLIFIFYYAIIIGITIGFSKHLYSVREGDGNVSVHIHKRGQNRASVTLQLSTRDGSAI